MKYTGPTYRPPFEANSLLLQVTTGCSHNKCAFCTMYRKVPFSIESMEQIEADLNEASEKFTGMKRVFLENGDAFVLSAERLTEIAELIHQKLSSVETIAMYASINNIKTKTDEELAALRKLGINALNIGLESGMDYVLDYMQKGYTSEEALIQLQRLEKAGIAYGLNIIFGAAGSELRKAHAIKTAELINQVHPYLIFTGTIHAEEGCPLYEDMKNGIFKENTIGEYLEEEELFLQRLNVDNCVFFGLHPSNIVEMRGILGKDKEEMLAGIQMMREQIGKRQLEQTPIRFGEGIVVL